MDFNLFAKDKEFVLKLINGILLIWLIIATVIIFSNIVNMVFKDPTLTYEEFKVVNCTGTSQDAIMLESDCQNSYAAVSVNERSERYYYYRSIVTCFFNILIVGGVLYLINKLNVEPAKPKPRAKKTTAKK